VSGDPMGMETFKLINPAETHTRLEIWINRMEPENDDADPNHFNWEKFQPERMIRFIDNTSSFLQTLARLKMEPLLLLGYSVEWLKDPANPEIPVTDVAEWAEFAVACLESFKRLGKDYQLYPKFVEVWNEPNLAQFWTGSAELYFRLFNTTAERIHRNYPEVLVGGPALTHIPECQPEKWMQDFLTTCGKQADFLSYHPYGEPVEKMVRDIKHWAQEFRKIPGKENGRIMITESDHWLDGNPHSWSKVQYVLERQFALSEIQDLLWSFHHFCVMAYQESGEYEFGILYSDGAIIEGTFWPYWLFRNYIGEQCLSKVDPALAGKVNCVASRYTTGSDELQNCILHNRTPLLQQVRLKIVLPSSKERILLFSRLTEKFKGLEKVELIRADSKNLDRIIDLLPGEGLALTFVEPGKPVFTDNDLNYQQSPYLALTPMRSILNLGEELELEARIVNTMLTPISGELKLMRVPDSWQITPIGNTKFNELRFGEEHRCSFKIKTTKPLRSEVIAPYLIMVSEKKPTSFSSELPHSIPVRVKVKNPLRLQTYPIPVEAVRGETNSVGVLITNQTSQQIIGNLKIDLPDGFKLQEGGSTFSIAPHKHTRALFTLKIPDVATPGNYQGKIVAIMGSTEFETEFEVRINDLPPSQKAIPVDLSKYFNFDAVAYFNNRRDYDREKMGLFVFPADFIPSGQLQKVFGLPFLFPSVEDGYKNCILPQGQKIELPPDYYEAVVFIGFGHDGKHPGIWTFQYADGTEENVESLIPEWCTPPPPGMRWAMTCPYRYIDGGPAEPACQLFYWEIPVNSRKQLTGLKLPTINKGYIFCITLKQR
ncbi:MAG: glycosyl hydrolase, partial [Candidatus Sumerlaeia bacterium]|nr:glycosyl hydrolase [Candidatus Sumerlaeia bacterium]